MGKRNRQEGRAKRFDWFIAVLVCIMLYCSYTVIDQQLHMNAVDQDYAAAQARLQAAQEENQALRLEKDRLNDPVYIEKVAREELGMMKPGEIPYIAGKK